MHMQEMHIVAQKIPKWSRKWILLQILSVFALIISLCAAIGSIEYVVDALRVSSATFATLWYEALLSE